MTQCWLRFESPVRVESQTLGDEIDKELIIAFEHLSERPCPWTSFLAFGVDERSRCTSSVCGQKKQG